MTSSGPLQPQPFCDSASLTGILLLSEMYFLVKLIP